MRPIDTILMTGKTGSGKGVQARLLQQKLGFTLFSSGDRFREIKQTDTAIGNRIREDMDKGLLMPSWLSIYVFQEGLFKLKTSEGIVFEGTARKRPEAESFHEIANWLGRSYLCIHLVVPDEEVIRRQVKRGREDSNNKEKIQTRLEEYRTYTASVIDFFREKNKLVDVDGLGTPEEIHERILEILKEKGTLNA